MTKSIEKMTKFELVKKLDYIIKELVVYQKQNEELTNKLDSAKDDVSYLEDKSAAHAKEKVGIMMDNKYFCKRLMLMIETRTKLEYPEYNLLAESTIMHHPTTGEPGHFNPLYEGIPAEGQPEDFRFLKMIYEELVDKL